MIHIGIDPGKSGGIAVINDDAERTAETFPYSDEQLIEVCTAHRGETVAFVEKVGAMPGQGVTSMFNFGKSFGYILGVLEATETPYQLVSPQKWKNAYGLNSDKGRSCEVCRRLFPKVNLLRTAKCRKEHDGMAEALLIAEYGRRTAK